MKRFIIYAVLATATCTLHSCYKDLGNYTYKPVNKPVIANIDTTNGYVISLGDTLTVTPTVTFTLDPNGTHGYKYEWSWFNNVSGDQIISTDKDLHVRVNLAPGSYSLQYRVTDTTSGVLTHMRTTVLVKTDVYEGYLVLNDINGSSRLDMLSYDATNAKFTQYTDVLAKMGSHLPAQGQPYKVLATRVSNAFNFSDSTYGIYLVTASGTNRIHPETFEYNPTYNIRYEIAGDIPADFKAGNLIADPATYFISIYMVADNNVYLRTGGVPLYNLPINKFVGKPQFKASPYIVSDGSGHAVLFDLDDKKFAVTNSTNGTTVTDPPDPGTGEFAFPTGQDLLFMDKSASGYGYAITRVPNTTSCYLTRFFPGSMPTYYRQITGTDIDKATHFAFSANPEYLFYSVGGKVYENDLFLQTSKLMLDKGATDIDYLAIPRFSASRIGARASTYGQWYRWLNVGAGGTLEQYSIKDANEPLVLQKSWTGFGKIVSISYRER